VQHIDVADLFRMAMDQKESEEVPAQVSNEYKALVAELSTENLTKFIRSVLVGAAAQPGSWLHCCTLDEGKRMLRRIGNPEEYKKPPEFVIIFYHAQLVATLKKLHDDWMQSGFREKGWVLTFAVNKCGAKVMDPDKQARLQLENYFLSPADYVQFCKNGEVALKGKKGPLPIVKL